MKKMIKNNLISIMVITLFSFMTIGYALYDRTVSLNGNITITQPGIIEITDITILEDKGVNIVSYGETKADGMNITFNVTTGDATTSTAVYLVEVTNNSFYDYTLTSFPINATITNSSYVPEITAEITNYETGEPLTAGEVIPVGKAIVFKAVINFKTRDSNVTINGSGSAAATEDNSGEIIASISPTSGNIQEEPIACFNVSVMNTFKYARTLTFTSSNSNILLVDKNGNMLGDFTIAANTTNEDYEICTMASEDSIFVTKETTTTISISSNDISDVVLDEITLAVNISKETDKVIPTVGGVSIAISETAPVDGEAVVSWSRIDSGGTDIVSYYIVLYKNGTKYGDPISTGSSLTNYTLSGLSEGDYYAVVYGEDMANNIGTNYVESATTADGYASKSETTSLKWLYSVDTSNVDSSLTYSGESTALIYSSYTATISVSSTVNFATRPNSITVKMNDTELTSGTDYTYDASTGTITVKKVTGNIAITATAMQYCLIEGTKIRLADGNTKNIEDIDYTDLLAVVDHENGGITYEYPIWIEEEKSTSNYQRTTFSDGTILETYQSHAIFSMDALGYVSVTDRDNFKIGTKVAKIREDGSINIVSVTNIETIYEKVNYYQVISTRYHNVISNDFVTSEGTLITTYAFEHNEDLTWTSARNEFLTKNDLFYYEDWTQLFPEHIFKGFRMEEAKHLYNKYPFDIEYYAGILSNLVGNTTMSNTGNNLWMVTTSDDILDGSSKYLEKEGSYYTLKSPINRINFIEWYNTADNKIYNIGDKVKVTYGMHFIAKYK